MGTIRARPRHLFSWGFDLDLDGVAQVSFDTRWLVEGGRFTWAGTEHLLSREGAWSGDFLLTAGEQTLARATKQSVLTRTFTIHVDGRELTLGAASWLSRRFELIEHGSVIGVVVPDHLFTRVCTVDLPNDLSIPTRVFLFWLVVLMWRRAGRSSGAS